jgi:ligand-binding sensor protein
MDGTMQLTDLMPLNDWMIFEKEIHKHFGMDSNVFNTDGIRITSHKAWVNKLCPAIKATDKGQSFICAVAHMNLATMANNTKKAVVEECDAGIAKIVVPIFVADEFLGAVGACGKCLPDGEVDAFLVNKITEIDDETIESLSKDVDTISSEHVDELIQFVENRIGEIVANYSDKR